MKFLSSLLTRDNITLFLAIVGSLGTAFSFLYIATVNRKNLCFRVVRQRSTDSKSILLYMAFENNSRLPISITGLSILLDNIPYSCVEIPVVALEETTRVGGKITSHKEFTTIPIPLFIPSLGCASGYVFFEFPEVDFQSEPTALTFVIHTNRGKAIETTLPRGTLFD